MFIKCVNKWICMLFFLNFIVLFLAVQGLNCCSGFSVVVVSRAPLHWSARASHCSDFFCGAGTRGHIDLSSYGSWALEHRPIVVAHGFSCSITYEIFPYQGSKSLSSVLADKFFTTEPPGKSCYCNLMCNDLQLKNKSFWNKTKL